MNSIKIAKTNQIAPLILFIFFLLFYQSSVAQKSKKQVLITIANQPIFVEEFEQLYQKNSEFIVDKSNQELLNYLDLFINFKLKLMDARAEGLDTLTSYKTELDTYRAQLIEPFLKDESTVEMLAKEAYQRLKIDVNASHILLQLPQNYSLADTLAVYTKINDIRTQIINGVDFESMAKAFSQDPSAKENGGNLGYFTAFNMIYPFETVSYNTKVGEISMPFRTRFGYHIVKINDRKPTKGEIEVAHILVKDADAETNINAIYQQVLQGESFENLAKRFSADQNSASNGGKLVKFRAGRLLKEFEDIAFNLNEGEISKPFKTSYGWHLVKLIKYHPLPSFEQLENELKSRVQNDQRSEIISNLLANQLKQRYQFKENSVLSLSINKIDTMDENAVLFSINQKEIKVNQFKKYLINQKTTDIFDNYKEFKNLQLITFHKDNLEHENAEFAAVMKEYKEGLLLFEILQRKIWDQSEKDTIGLNEFYNKNSSNYRWDKRIKGSIISCKDESIANAIILYLNNGNLVENIKKDFTKNSAEIDLKTGIFEQESLFLPKSFDFKEGISKIYRENDKWNIVVVDEVLLPSLKTKEEAKGKLINDYQHYLDEQWIKALRKQYKVKINQKELNKLISKNQH